MGALTGCAREVNERNFLEKYAEAYCDAWMRCPDTIPEPKELTEDLDDCISTFERINDHLLEENVPATCSFDYNLANACVADVYDSCNSQIVVHGCDEVWVCEEISD